MLTLEHFLSFTRFAHFLYRSTRPTGSTRLKRRQLEAVGWRLVSVPYFEWADVARGARDRQERDAFRRQYLADLLGIEARPNAA